MSERKTEDGLQDDIVAFDNYLEVVADASVMELTTDHADHVRPPPPAPAVIVSRPVDDGGEGRCKAACRCVYGLMSSSVGLILLLTIYTLLGAAVLHHTEYDRELQMHAQLDHTRRRVIADIINLTATHHRPGDRPRDRGDVINITVHESSDPDDIRLADAVEALLVEYGDARQALNPSAKTPSWTFTGAMYFCGTVYTTIGYGNVAPVTTVGRFITIVYAIVGIPLCLVVLASVGKLLTRAIKYLWSFVRRFYYTGSFRRVRRMIPVSRLRMTPFQRTCYVLRRRTQFFRRAVRRRKTAADIAAERNENEKCVPYEVDDKFNLPVAIAVIIGISYTLLGALMYMSWENWSYFEAVYFTCISLSTIGFGDVVPDHPKFFIASSVYVVIGLSLLAMIINVIMVAMHVTITKVTNRVIEASQRLAAERQDTDSDVEPEDIIVPETTRPQRSDIPLPPAHRRGSF